MNTPITMMFNHENELVKQYLPMLRRLVLKYDLMEKSVAIEDREIYSEGLIILLNTIRDYDPEKSHITPHIFIRLTYGLIRYLRNKSNYSNKHSGLKNNRLQATIFPLHVNHNMIEKTFNDNGFDIDIRNKLQEWIKDHRHNETIQLYTDDMKQYDIAKVTGVTQQRVSDKIKQFIKNTCKTHAQYINNYRAAL